MTAAGVAALVDALDDGPVECDGLLAERTGDTYRLAVDGTRADDLSEADFRERLADREPYVWNWYFWVREAPPGEDRRAWLRWLEGASEHDAATQYDRLDDGVRAEWGQLLIEVRLVDGERRYSLRHVADAEDPDRAAIGGDAEDARGATAEGGAEDGDSTAAGGDADATLETYDDPLDARELATLDEDGRYRPLKTAPTLRTGWAFPDLAADGLVRAVEFLYPATIANWHREREGELDVDHWVPTAERQTGIYDVVDELPREALEWVAEACCVDSQCLRRRRWGYEDGDELAVERGDGEFPCREPCSLVIAAARQWTILEDETERTYELELTASELHQLGAIVDAVADGRVDDVREADVNDPANRYRARYLRAKRLDGDELRARESED